MQLPQSLEFTGSLQQRVHPAAGHRLEAIFDFHAFAAEILRILLVVVHK